MGDFGNRPELSAGDRISLDCSESLATFPLSIQLDNGASFTQISTSVDFNGSSYSIGGLPALLLWLSTSREIQRTYAASRSDSGSLRVVIEDDVIKYLGFALFSDEALVGELMILPYVFSLPMIPFIMYLVAGEFDVRAVPVWLIFFDYMLPPTIAQRMTHPISYLLVDGFIQSGSSEGFQHLRHLPEGIFAFGADDYFFTMPVACAAHRSCTTRAESYNDKKFGLSLDVNLKPLTRSSYPVLIGCNVLMDSPAGISLAQFSLSIRDLRAERMLYQTAGLRFLYFIYTTFRKKIRQINIFQGRGLLPQLNGIELRTQPSDQVITHLIEVIVKGQRVPALFSYPESLSFRDFANRILNPSPSVVAEPSTFH